MLSIFVARDIVCSAVVGVSSISVADLMSVSAGSKSPLRFAESDRMVVDGEMGAGRWEGLAESLCASCAVSWAMSGVERALV